MSDRGSEMELTKAEVVSAVERQRARSMDLLRPLTDDQWNTTALPGWRVREVVGHLVSTDEGALTGRMLRMGVRPTDDGGLAAVEAWNEEQVHRWSDRPPAEILAGLEKWGRRIVRTFKATPGVVLRRRVPLPFGKVPLQYLGELRVLDEWVHEQDIRRALTLEAAPDLVSIAAAARMMINVVPHQTPIRIPDGAKGSVSLTFDGADVPPLFCDLSSKTFRLDGGAVDATITARAAEIVMVAAGRDPWRDQESAGAIKIQGDRTAAETLLDALRAA